MWPDVGLGGNASEVLRRAGPAGDGDPESQGLAGAGARVTVAGSPVTQQLAPAHFPAVPAKAEPEFAAVTPLAMVTFSRSVLVPSLLMIAVSQVDLPGATVRLKYGRGWPADVGDGVR